MVLCKKNALFSVYQLKENNVSFLPDYYLHYF